MDTAQHRITHVQRAGVGVIAVEEVGAPGLGIARVDRAGEMVIAVDWRMSAAPGGVTEIVRARVQIVAVHQMGAASCGRVAVVERAVLVVIAIHVERGMGAAGRRIAGVRRARIVVIAGNWLMDTTGAGIAGIGGAGVGVVTADWTEGSTRRDGFADTVWMTAIPSAARFPIQCPVHAAIVLNTPEKVAAGNRFAKAVVGSMETLAVNAGVVRTVNVVVANSAGDTESVAAE
jgi:hypothetical protein